MKPVGSSWPDSVVVNNRREILRKQILANIRIRWSKVKLFFSVVYFGIWIANLLQYSSRYCVYTFRLGILKVQVHTASVSLQWPELSSLLCTYTQKMTKCYIINALTLIYVQILSSNSQSASKLNKTGLVRPLKQVTYKQSLKLVHDLRW